MFSELLSNSDKCIFLQAVDEFFDNKKLMNASALELNVSPSSSSSITSEDSSIEAYLEDLNVKFYESLNESNDKDISTEFDSEESDSSDGSSRKIYVKNFIKNTSDAINAQVIQVKNFYMEQIELRNKIKAMFNKSSTNESKKSFDNNKKQKTE